jgi:hypothetical protein
MTETIIAAGGDASAHAGAAQQSEPWHVVFLAIADDVAGLGLPTPERIGLVRPGLFTIDLADNARTEEWMRHTGADLGVVHGRRYGHGDYHGWRVIVGSCTVDPTHTAPAPDAEAAVA